MIEVIDEEERVAHVLDAAIMAGEVAGKIDWQRRFDHMQQHSGQHLLSAVLEELFKIPTVSFHLGSEVCTIDVTAPSLAARQIEQAEERCAEIVSEARPLAITFEDAAAGLRKESQRTGTLRVVAIDGIDRSACGGTHVRTTAEIGPVAIRKTEKIRGNTRLEFVCGLRAQRHGRADFRSLLELSRLLSVPAAETPALVASQLERIKALEKANQRLAAEIAQREGRELWAATAPGPDGVRRVTQRLDIDDTLRTRAQAFAAEGKAAFLAVSLNPPAILLAASADSGIHAGDRVKAAVSAAGGRGGGNQLLAQGSLPATANLDAIAEILL